MTTDDFSHAQMHFKGDNVFLGGTFCLFRVFCIPFVGVISGVQDGQRMPENWMFSVQLTAGLSGSYTLGRRWDVAITSRSNWKPKTSL